MKARVRSSVARVSITLAPEKDIPERNKQKKQPKRLRDKTLHQHGFKFFSSSSVASDGQVVIFSYPSGSRYIVSLQYILTWFSEVQRGEPPTKAIRSRRLSDPHLVRLYFSNDKCVDVAWDTVLMACEPRYEHYGGLTEESKALTKEWSKKLDSVKIEEEPEG